MIIRLIKYLRGYLRVRLSGYAPERFLNLCSHHQILIWDLASQANDYTFYISVQGFRQLRPILRKTKTRLVVLEKRGLPFFLHRYRRRKMFFLGIAACMGLLYTLSLFIWDIHIEGNYSRTTETILGFLKEQRIFHGIPKSQVNCEEIEAMLRNHYNDIIWTSAKIRGTRLIISVQENTDVPVAGIQGEGATDLRADRAATIVSIITRRGTPAVKAGDTVQEGDLLVGGRLDILDDSGEIAGYAYCNADADIYARAAYDYYEEFPLEYQHREFSGKSKKNYALRLFDKTLTFWNPAIPYREYDTVTDARQARIGENFYLPLVLEIQECREYSTSQRVYSHEEAAALAGEKVSAYCDRLTERGAQILENNIEIQVRENSCVAVGTLIVVEKMGRREPAEIVEVKEEGTGEEDGGT